MHWADYRNDCRKAKVPIGFDINQSIPSKIFLTNGKADERPQGNVKVSIKKCAGVSGREKEGSIKGKAEQGREKMAKRAIKGKGIPAFPKGSRENKRGKKKG